MLAQEVRCAASYDHRVPFLPDVIHDVLHHGHHAVGVEHLAAKWRVALIASAPENFRQTMQAAVHALVAALDRRGMDLGDAGDLIGEKLVPHLPTQATGQLNCNLGCAAAKLAFDGYDAKHGFLVYCHSSAGLRFFDEEHGRNHKEDRDAQELEAIDIGKHGGLAQYS